jgi:hypothetical protein
VYPLLCILGQPPSVGTRVSVVEDVVGDGAADDDVADEGMLPLLLVLLSSPLINLLSACYSEGGETPFLKGYEP